MSVFPIDLQAICFRFAAPLSVSLIPAMKQPSCAAAKQRGDQTSNRHDDRGPTKELRDTKFH